METGPSSGRLARQECPKYRKGLAGAAAGPWCGDRSGGERADDAATIEDVLCYPCVVEYTVYWKCHLGIRLLSAGEVGQVQGEGHKIRARPYVKHFCYWHLHR